MGKKGKKKDPSEGDGGGGGSGDKPGDKGQKKQEKQQQQPKGTEGAGDAPKRKDVKPVPEEHPDEVKQKGKGKKGGKGADGDQEAQPSTSGDQPQAKPQGQGKQKQKETGGAGDAPKWKDVKQVPEEPSDAGKKKEKGKKGGKDADGDQAQPSTSGDQSQAKPQGQGKQKQKGGKGPDGGEVQQEKKPEPAATKSSDQQQARDKSQSVEPGKSKESHEGKAGEKTSGEIPEWKKKYKKEKKRQEQEQQPTPAPQSSAWGQQAGAWGQQPSPSQQQQWGQQQPVPFQQQAARGPQPMGQQAMPRQAPTQQQQPPRQVPMTQQPTQGMRGTQSRSQTSPSTQSLVSGMSDMSIKTDSSLKSYHGTRGERMTIEANYVDLDIAKMLNDAYHYDVKIDPDKPKRLLRLAFNQFRVTKFPKIFMAYDGKSNCYSPIKLNPNDIRQAVEVKIDDQEFGGQKTFKITLKETGDVKIELSSLRDYRNNRVFDKPMRALQCLDIVLQSACINKAKQCGRSFYRKPARSIDLSDGYELYLGLFQATVLGDTPLLNIDVSHKAFPYTGSVLDVLKTNRYCDINRELDRRAIEKLHEYLRGIHITYVPPTQSIDQGKDYTYNELKLPSNKQKFTHDGKEITIQQYFQKEKNYRLQYPHLPCLWVGGKNRNIYLPLELCHIRAGQVTTKKTGTEQVRHMIKYAAISTVDRKSRIMDLFNYFSHATDPTINAFGLRLGRQFITVDSRIINAPQILYRSSAIHVRKGSWNHQNMQYLQAATCVNWAICITDSYVSDFDAKKLADMVVQQGRRLAMNISEKPATVGKCFDRNGPGNFLKDCKAKNITLVFVILNRNRDCYSNIKTIAETQVGILTQCIKSETMQKRLNPSTISNILLKVNTKLNGENHKIAPNCEIPMLKKDLVMFLGADVTHPSPDQTRIPSVVGVVSSYNDSFAQYNESFRLQGPKIEMISDMKSILQEHLKFFKQKRGRLPEKIIYYRDGVSDGQFEQLRSIELNAMNQACAQMEHGYRPMITCIVVQKRHHTRFFPDPKSKLLMNDRYLNVPPGTIVDTKITHPKENQFFLVSHESIQGTAKPTKYCVIRDDNKINVDDMQAMTYNLCHMFSRCNRAVSYPTPAYYAHLAAARGRAYIENRQINLNNLDREYNAVRLNSEFVQQYPSFFV